MLQVLTELEVKRKEISRSMARAYYIIGFGILVIALGLILLGGSLIAIIIGIIIIILGIGTIYSNSPKKANYRREFKSRVICMALKSVDQSLELDPINAFSEHSFLRSGLFKQRPDRYHSEDQVFGSSGKTRFNFSEVHAEYKTVTQTKNGRQEHWHDIFKGIVFCADFNKNFNGHTLIEPKGIGNMLGTWLYGGAYNSTMKVVKLENPDFSKEFITYSEDQIEARYILTPAMMDRLCELNNRCEKTITLSFTGSVMFIAFPLDKNYFEPPVFKTLLDSELLKEDLEVIRFMYGIINELDLNTRIWGKE